jgi:hypothetical protein
MCATVASASIGLKSPQRILDTSASMSSLLLPVHVYTVIIYGVDQHHILLQCQQYSTSHALIKVVCDCSN